MIHHRLLNLLILWSLLNLIYNILEAFGAGISNVWSSWCPSSYNIIRILYEILWNLRRLLMVLPPLNWHLLLTWGKRNCRNKVRIKRIKRIERIESILIFRLVVNILLLNLLLQIRLLLKLACHRPLLGEVLN